MSTLNTLFRKRIGLSETQPITFNMLDDILEKIAITIPFENLCVISKNTSDINEENLIQKILVKNEGGLCYELNTILYYFLLQNEFKVELARAIVFDHNHQDFAAIGRTHVIILLTHGGNIYVVDTGFGGNLPLRPVPLSGESVSSFNGEFRIRNIESKHGDYLFEMKLTYKDTDWKLGYAFFSTQPITDMSEMDLVQKIINENPLSSLNKSPLITKLTRNGNVILTDTSYTIWNDGKVTKEEIDQNQFKKLAKQYFQID
jgi:N-hydroxyarylamine O-acetyltransferase